MGAFSILQACGFSCKPLPSCLHLSSTRPGPRGGAGGGGEASGSLAISKDEDLGSGEPLHEWPANPTHPVPAHSPATPSTANQTAVLVPAAPGCRPGQHPLSCLQSFPVPHICASHDSHPRPTHHVRTAQGLASQWVMGQGHSLAQCGHHGRLLQGTGGVHPEA